MANHKSANIVKWKQEVSKWSASGLSQHEYCRRMNIPCSTFHGWYSKLKKLEGESLSSVSNDFVKLQFNDSKLLSEEVQSHSSGINILIGGCINICLHRGFEAKELQRTVSALLEVI